MLCQPSTQPQYIKIIWLYRGENDPMDLIIFIGFKSIFYPHQDEFMWNMSGVVCLGNIEEEQLDNWAPPQILKSICANHYGLAPLNLEYVHRPIYFYYIYIYANIPKKVESVQKLNESVDESMKSMFTRTQKNKITFTKINIINIYAKFALKWPSFIGVNTLARAT